MPAARAASSREAPSSTSARASIRREAAVSRHRLASRRSSTAPGSFRVIATVMAPPPIGYTADHPRQAPRGSRRDDASAIRPVGITLWKRDMRVERLRRLVPTPHLLDDPVRLGGPDEGPRIGVVLVEVAVD